MICWFRLQFMILLHFLFHLSTSTPIVQELRLTLASAASSYNYHEPEGPGTYAFGYEVDDPETENTQFRDEERHPNGSVTGKYGWVGPDGNVYLVRYIADEKGYRATVENNPPYIKNSRRSIYG